MAELSLPPRASPAPPSQPATHDWNQHYVTGETPWDVGRVDDHLARFVDQGRLEGTRVLEIGCGTGTNALWLAARGYDVVAVDLASLAIERAQAKATAAGSACDFQCLDFLAADPPGVPFDFVFDRGCFHVFDDAATRSRFAHRVASLLRPEGLWLSLLGSTEGGARPEGPPRRSARDVTLAVEPALELIELRQVEFATDQPVPALAWLSLARKRLLPAQPSTLR